MAGIVWFDGTRVNNADSLTGWANGGAAPTLEPDFYYQGTGCISALIKTTEVGFYYTSTAQNLSATNGTWLAKIIQTNKDAIDGLGLQLRIGSTTAVYCRYEIFSSITYPSLGGWQIIPINPNIVAYRTQTVGTQNLASVTYWDIRSDANATAKAPNVGMDAIDWMPNGTGLSVSGSSCTFTDYVLFDEENSANRYGVIITKEGILYANGTLTIGNNNATTFSDSSRIIIFPTGRFDTGFCGLKLNLTNASTVIDLDTITLIGRGLPGTPDTRPNFSVVGTGGTSTISSCVFTSFNTIVANAKINFTDCTFNIGGLLTQDSSTIDGCLFDNFTSGASVLCNNPALVTYCTFNSDGSNHALEITTGGTYNLVGNVFNDYAPGVSGTTGNEAIYNNSGTHLILNIIDSDSVPSYRNGAGSTTQIVTGQVSITFSGLKVNTELRIYRVDDDTELAGIEDSSTGFTYSYTYSSPIDVYVRIFNLNYIDITLYITLGNVSTTIPIQQIFDRNFSNP